MKEHKYILDAEGNPVLETDLLKWGKWFQTNDEARRIKQERVGDLFVSTVFLGLDHNFNEKGKPILFETMVFKESEDQDMTKRYYTKEEAIRGHDDTVEEIKSGRSNP